MRQSPLLEVDPHVRRELDFYQTFRWQVEALLRRIVLQPHWRIVEPCAGELAIARPLRARGLSVITNDVLQRAAALDCVGDAALERTWDRFGDVDLAITNMPFNAAFPIIWLACQRCRVGVISLLRTTWSEPVEDRASGADKDEWLAAHPLAAKIEMPRAKYRGTGSGDSATHAWFIWAKDPALVSAAPAPFGGPHMTVTRRERDELVAQFGKGHA